ncbi:MAG TPA: hypothetical protein PKE35_11690 [Anaerolineales bacterium]|nr:hypothetical protein [Anaerolineales bacterium]HMX18851.1 hypothetical protein [Anaerolineales bacterium]HMX74910.1 hypothetical protein [Anaerolineales bacterium]HMZ44051.1 hypothetical protein [Anaerolineales bacterium]HNA53457.1 hypothetical protein [Anaerolineales bacterium]
MRIVNGRVALVFALAALFLLTGCGGGEKYTYRVNGLAGQAHVEYASPDGSMVEEDVQLPWSIEVDLGNSAEFTLYATNASEFGTVHCEVLKGEFLVGDASGSVFAGCSGSVTGSGDNTKVNFKGFDDVPPDSRSLPTSGGLVAGNELIMAVGGNVLDGLDLYVLDPASPGRMAKLTKGLYSAFCPAISPDGTKIAFRKRDIRWDIFVMTVSDSTLRRITDNEAEEGCPVWSPDGQNLAFDSRNESAFSEIILSSSDGRTQNLLTAALRAEQPEANFYSPNWSPDGKQIAFTLRLKDNDIYLMNIEDGSASPLEVTPDQNEAFPRWSPDGESVLFFRKDGIYIGKADGSGSVKVNTGSLIPDNANWSPDGARIVFSADDKETEIKTKALYLVNLDGSGLTLFAEIPNTDLFDPFWQSFASDSPMLKLQSLPVVPTTQQ